MSTLLVVASLLVISTINAAPCIPADTCFQSKSSSLSIRSTKYTCSGGKVTRHLYTGCTDCSCSSQTAVVTDLSDLNVIDSGSTSGTLSANIVQGSGCPVLTSSSSSCTEYMYIKKYGASNYINDDGEDAPYQDVGTNCANKGTTWDGFMLPIGCADLSKFTVGRQVFSCSLSANPNTFGYDYYDGDCPSGGIFKTAQSDSYTTNECGLFSEHTHCGGTTASDPTICSTGGVLVEYPYWIDLLCCGDCDMDTITPQPTRATPGPTTANPTDQYGTGKPTTPAPTAIPAKDPSGVNPLGYIVSVIIVMIGVLFY